MSADLFYEHRVIGKIHHLLLLQPTGEAVRVMLEYVEQTIVGHPLDGKNRVLMDFRPAGAPPITEGLPHLLAFLRRHPKDPNLSVRIAYIYERGTHGRILNGFLSMQRFMPQGMVVKFFADADYEQALEWLHA